MRAGVVLALVLAGCHRAGGDGGATADGAGARLEAAAITAGLVVDPASRAIEGAWARDTDRACIVPHEGGDDRIGLLIDYGQGQGCVGEGSVHRRGADTLDLTLGGGCRIAARFEGERIVLPPEVPAACDRLCTGRVSLAAMTLERQSGAVSEGQSLRTPAGRLLCPG